MVFLTLHSIIDSLHSTLSRAANLFHNVSHKPCKLDGYTIIAFGVERLYFIPTILSNINIDLLPFRYKYIFALNNITVEK